MYAEQHEVDTDADRLVNVDCRSCHWVIVTEQIRQQSLLVRRVAELVRRCNAKHCNYDLFTLDFSAANMPQITYNEYSVQRAATTLECSSY